MPDSGGVTCRLCGGGPLKRLYRISEWRVDRCRNCSFVQVSNPPSLGEIEALYDADYYDHGKYTDTSALDRENRRRLALVDRSGLNAGAMMLDLGCAGGDFIAAASGRYAMWGIDISEAAIESAKKANPSRAEYIRAGAFHKGLYEPMSFDAVAMWDVLEHVADPRAFIEDVAALLRPGGRLFVSTTNIGALTARVFGSRWPFMTVPEHMSFFTKRTLELLFVEQFDFTMRYWATRGKWVNFGFLLYKIHRVVKVFDLLQFFEKMRMHWLIKRCVYVPTTDIQYGTFEKSS